MSSSHDVRDRYILESRCSSHEICTYPTRVFALQYCYVIRFTIVKDTGEVSRGKRPLISYHMSSCNKDDLSLLELIWRQRWLSVNRRVIAHSYELDLEHQGLSAFHWACCNDPPASTLRNIMLQTNGVRYASEKDINGHTPLICLLSNTTCDNTNNDILSVDSIKAFCTYAPESISICDNLKQSPLHHMLCGHMLCERDGAVEHRSNLEIIKLLLLTDPSLANAKNSDGETALDNLWKSCVDRGADAPCGYFWTVVELILSASSSSSSCCCSNNETTPNGGSILHQLVSYPECCDTMLDYAIGCNPDSLLDSTDELGNTVLHRAILTNNRNASIISILIRRAPSLVLRLN